MTIETPQTPATPIGAASVLTAGLEPMPGCEGCRKLQGWARTAWQRGHRMGMLENERIAREATEALRREKADHAETNSRLTEALMSTEADNDKLRAALRLSTNGLRHCAGWNISEEKEKALMTVVMENETLLGSNKD